MDNKSSWIERSLAPAMGETTLLLLFFDKDEKETSMQKGSDIFL